MPHSANLQGGCPLDFYFYFWSLFMNMNKSSIRTIEILHSIAANPSQLTLTEISRRLNIPKSTTYQILMTLVSLKVLEIDKDKTFRLGIRFFEIALPSFDRMDLRRVARPIMEELSKDVGETVFLATHDAGEIIYLHQVEGPTRLRLSVTIGTRGPMHCTALGKAILAALPEHRVRQITGGGALTAETRFTLKTHASLLEDLRGTRARGYAIDISELQDDIACVGAPLYDSSSYPIGALSVAGPVSSFNGERLKWIGEQLQAAALGLSRRLGFGKEALYL